MLVFIILYDVIKVFQVHLRDNCYILIPKGDELSEESLSENQTLALKHLLKCHNLRVDTFRIISFDVESQVITFLIHLIFFRI